MVPRACSFLTGAATSVAVLGTIVVARTGDPPPGQTGWEAARLAVLQRAIADVEAGRGTTPLIGVRGPTGAITVTFLARREGGRAPRVVSDVTGWGEHLDGTFDFQVGRMARVGRSEWYALDAEVAAGARVEYLLAYSERDYRLDPHNPRRVEAPSASEFVTAGYEPPEWASGSPEAAGTLTESVVDSAALRGPRTVGVYSPAVREPGEPLPVAVFLQRPARDVARVLDWAISSRAIGPVAAVFVDPGLDGVGPGSRTPLATFLNEELPAWLAAHHGTSAAADRRAVIAVSYAARDALEAALAPSGAYGGLGLLIPGRRIGPADIAEARRARASGLRVAILAGQYDHANLATARTVRDALRETGLAVAYVEVPEGHNPRTWQSHLQPVLVALFGPPRPPARH